MRGKTLSANSKSLQIRKIIVSIILALLAVISLCMASCKQDSGSKPAPGPVDPIDPDESDDPEDPETQKIEINGVEAVVSLADERCRTYERQYFRNASSRQRRPYKNRILYP